ncbi:hypothetical protein DV515_00017361 [Chloebia gouldiae]|uniref:Uncharacterized protein n=1 Tax=Chloebia gouldiae TaxID=44316 RepID=A0A3L8QWW8_CHLGU|nr:hypothetical protein DV515_00017372 [Chloebia gouldiae]RLV71514.1 hypothetical protein DV515_00017375 [Chloebia gouldiae]RLV71525.1 hypothetical protein DV515_00017361 [Chloebia gouldiae]
MPGVPSLFPPCPSLCHARCPLPVPSLSLPVPCPVSPRCPRRCPQKHERQAQHHFQQQQRRKREEEERQRHAELQARRDRDPGRDEATKAEATGQDPAHDKGQAKGKSSGGSSAHGPDKPKRPSSLLATNNVMKLKQIIPLQGKFLSGGTAAAGTAAARSPQSPTGNENKLPGFLSFKFLKSPETKRDAGTEKVQSPTKPFNPGKLFNFGKSEGLGGNGGAAGAAPQPRAGPSADAAPGKSHLNEEGAREEAENRAEEEGGGARL